eukprot:gb/GEZN01010074.1/.p1 GENE.gb/GEZN01010074.1/~~gb/GEZN01010074.1/.p1  ORF type:complete len:329 (-),score=-13.31 gb/GEZN01010074.1/:285-1196(-)
MWFLTIVLIFLGKRVFAKWPFVSVCIPCSQKHLGGIMNVIVPSIEYQTEFPNEVVISISNPEKSNLTDQLSSIEQRLAVFSVSFQAIDNHRHVGPGENRNLAIAGTSPKCDYVVTSDADDQWHPQRIELVHYAIQRFARLGVLMTSFVSANQKFCRYERGFVGVWATANVQPNPANTNMMVTPSECVAHKRVFCHHIHHAHIVLAREFLDHVHNSSVTLSYLQRPHPGSEDGEYLRSLFNFLHYHLANFSSYRFVYVRAAILHYHSMEPFHTVAQIPLCTAVSHSRPAVSSDSSLPSCPDSDQ